MKVLLLLFFLSTAIVSFQGSQVASEEQIHLLRPQSGSGGRLLSGLSCLSWRLAVEANNIIKWKTIPETCEGYVGHYMLGHQYRKDIQAVVYAAIEYAKSLNISKDGKDIWIFDIDETTLSNLPYYAKHGFGAEPYNSTLFDEWVFEGKAPALPGTLKLYRKILHLGIKPVFLTGRSEDQRNVTRSNLKNVGYRSWLKLILRRSSESGTAAVVYKSTHRAELEASGYRIVGNIGDQWSDILGTHEANRSFKLPDPMYYIS